MNSDAAILAAVAAEAASAARTSRPSQIEAKADQDFVTDVDHALEERIRVALEKAFPGVPARGEESVANDAHLPDTAFLIDPLDGTGNWIAGLRWAAVSIALIERGETVLAAVADIHHGISYAAAAGAGAWRDGERLAAGDEPGGLIALSTGLLDLMEDRASFHAIRKLGRLRNLGAQSLHLCAAAEGALALVASFEARLWDDAAGRLIAREAGVHYRSFIAPADRDRPAARQRSLCAHPAIWDAAESVLAPILSR